jgi:transcription-repair coupling factor (superfamily II helicase)
MIGKLRNNIVRSEPFVSLNRRLRNLSADAPLRITGLPGSLLAIVAVEAFQDGQHQVLLVASDEDRAGKLRDDCALLAGESSVRFFGAQPLHQAQQLDVTSSLAQIETLRSLAGGEPVIVIASPNSIAGKVPPPKRFTESSLDIETGHEYPFAKLTERLHLMGFDRKDFVESYGDFAVRGGILDVYPFTGENPVRLEFWGDSVESIREFDVLSQRSIRELQSASIIPSFAREGGAPESDAAGQMTASPDLS